MTLIFARGRIVEFQDNLLDINTRIDERNLIFCKNLNFLNSDLTILDTAYLSSLCVLVLENTTICSIDTVPIKNLEYLNISGTQILSINTTPLCEL